MPSTWSLTHVRLGEWDTSLENDCDDSSDEKFCNDPPIDVAIEQKLPHENYDPQGANQHNDIALLRLSRDVPYSRSIRPICLPLFADVKSDLLINKTMSVAGWGEIHNSF